MSRFTQTNAALICMSVLLAGFVPDASAVSIARGLRGVRASSSGLYTDVSTSMPAGVDVEVIKKDLPTTKEGTKCLCPVGQFWHWRLASCIEQGPWGYECGFFPMEHHHRVCVDMLKCEPLKGANSTAHYHPYGDSLKASTFPASCTRCGPEDKCLSGQARQDEECLKQYKIDGKEACVTLKVSTIASAVASATESYTATAKELAEATATANANAQHTASATGNVKAGARARPLQQPLNLQMQRQRLMPTPMRRPAPPARRQKKRPRRRVPRQVQRQRRVPQHLLRRRRKALPLEKQAGLRYK